MIYTFWAKSLFFLVKFALFCKFYIFSDNFTLFSVESVLFSIKFTHCPYKIWRSLAPDDHYYEEILVEVVVRFRFIHKIYNNL